MIGRLKDTLMLRMGIAKEEGAAPQHDPINRNEQMLHTMKHPIKQVYASSSVVMVTPTMARGFRDNNHFPRQRNINQNNVKRLSNEMLDGKFIPGIQIYFAYTLDGDEWMLNGNHTCEAICLSGVDTPITITRVKVQDEDEAGMFYAVFDIQKVRTWGDSLRAVGAGDGIPMAGNVLSSIGVIEDDFGHRRAGARGDVSRLDRIDKLEDYREAAVLLAHAMEGGVSSTTRLIRRAAPMAVALETLRYQPSAAFEFWHMMAQDDGLRAGSPARAFLIWARNRIEAGAGGGGAEQREWSKAAAASWNAHFSDRKVQFVKPKSMRGFKLLGTPISVEV